MGLRRLKVNEALKETLSAVIASDALKDPRVGFVTVTGVETAPDLRSARVYVSVLGDEEARAACLEALSASSGYLQARIAEALRMKRTPQLRFFYDDTVDQALHIADLIDREAEVLGEEAPEIPVGSDDAEGDEGESTGEGQ